MSKVDNSHLDWCPPLYYNDYMKNSENKAVKRVSVGKVALTIQDLSDYKISVEIVGPYDQLRFIGDKLIEHARTQAKIINSFTCEPL